MPLFPSSISWVDRVASGPCTRICAGRLTHPAPVGPGAALRLALSTLALDEPFKRRVPAERSPCSCASDRSANLDKKEATAFRVFDGVTGSHFTLQQQDDFCLGEAFCAHEEGQGPVHRKFPQQGNKVEPSQGPLPDLKPTFNPLPLPGTQGPHPPKHFLSPRPLLSMPTLPGRTKGDRASRRGGWVVGLFAQEEAKGSSASMNIREDVGAVPSAHIQRPQLYGH